MVTFPDPPNAPVVLRAVPIHAHALKPGDLFSTEGPEYWSLFPGLPSIGERVYIRTYTQASNAADSNTTVYRIDIIHKNQE